MPALTWPSGPLRAWTPARNSNGELEGLWRWPITAGYFHAGGDRCYASRDVERIPATLSRGQRINALAIMTPPLFVSGRTHDPYEYLVVFAEDYGFTTADNLRIRLALPSEFPTHAICAGPFALSYLVAWHVAHGPSAVLAQELTGIEDLFLSAIQSPGTERSATVLSHVTLELRCVRNLAMSQQTWLRRAFPHELATGSDTFRVPLTTAGEMSYEPVSRWLTLDTVVVNEERRLGELSDRASELIGTISTTLTANLLVQAARQAEREGRRADHEAVRDRRLARLQRVATLVASAILVPALVASIFGANVPVPGQGTRRGWWAMTALMVGGGALTFALISAIESGQGLRLKRRSVAAMRDRERGREASRILPLAILVFGIVVVTAGVLLLVLGSVHSRRVAHASVTRLP